MIVMKYAPETGAPIRGEWDRSGAEPRWVQDHDALVVNALQSWKGSPTDMYLHMQDEADGAPIPSSGSGKQMRAEAGALLWELTHHCREAPPLYRGDHKEPSGHQPWTEDRTVAEYWAAKNNGRVFELPAGTMALRIADYLSSNGFGVEEEWIVCEPREIAARTVASAVAEGDAPLDARVEGIIREEYATWTESVERAKRLGITPAPEPQITISYVVAYLDQAWAPSEYRYQGPRKQYEMVRAALRRLVKSGRVHVSSGGTRLERWYEPVGRP